MNKFINERKNRTAPLWLVLLLLCCFAVPAVAQQGGPETPGEAPQNAGNQGGDLIRALNLTPGQIAKIRAIRQQNREEQRLAGERLRSAQRALDEAIYSDGGSETVVEERARELAAAQTAVIRQRALTELGIRRVLSPEQLNTLRELRRQQAQQRRLERQMNQPRRLRDNQPGDNDAQPTFPRDRFRARQNNPAQTDNDSLPADAPRARRRNLLRKARP